MPVPGPARRLAAALGAAVALLLLGYGVTGMVGGAIPTNAGWTEPERGVRIYLRSNGIHTDIVVPVEAAGVDWRGLAAATDLRDPRYAAYDHVAFGWGERRFYLETPRWSDVRPATILSAAIGSDLTLLHVEHLPAPGVDDDARSVVLRPGEYRRLADFIRATVGDRDGRRAAHRFGYGDHDAFYEARGHYSAIETCNAWTGDALRHAGVRIGAWTPFPVTVLGWFQR